MANKINNISIVLLAIGMFLIGVNYMTPAITGMVTGTTTVNVANVTTITMTVNTVAFGSMALGESNNTTDESPPPFVVRNDGNVGLNITIEATDLWASAANPTNNYQSWCGDTGEWACSAGSNKTASGIPAAASGTVLIYNLPYSDATDTAQIEINVTVPSSEAGGSKSSTITFTAGNYQV